jgi:hypothetical protein
MWAMLTALVWLLTRPMYSSIRFGLLPAAVIRLGSAISCGMVLRPPHRMILVLPVDSKVDQ